MDEKYRGGGHPSPPPHKIRPCIDHRVRFPLLAAGLLEYEIILISEFLKFCDTRDHIKEEEY